MPASRSIPANRRNVSCSRSSSCRFGWLLVLFMCVGVCGAEGCDGPSPSVVAVASVFTTLAVVAIVLVVAYVLLRRRNAGFLFPLKSTRKSNDLSAEAGTTGNLQNVCYDNPAFSGQDVKDVEEGGAKSSPKKNSYGSRSPIKAENQKTWTSLPGQEDSYPDGLHRQGSCGSLDNNYMGPATTSVWLQSQDIIGLGFNISGNMRDGIYVSQVHNRGPAVESGKIKVGDRIVSVTIAYDNIVYEDALTILSYASPYPVKVTLLKEHAINSDARAGLANEQLNHPLYRSQSLDALQRIGKDNPFRTKRPQSEMKAETRTSSPRKNRLSVSEGNARHSVVGGEDGTSWSGKKDRKSKGTSKGFSSDFTDFSPATLAKFDVSSDVMVHAAEAVDVKANPDGEFQPAQEFMKAVKGSSAESAPQRTPSPDPEGRGGPASGIDAEDARNFASMMDQMMDGKTGGGGGGDGDGMIVAQASSGRVSASPKARPNKPERKKKSSGSSLSFDDPEELFSGGGGVEETVQAVKAVTAYAMPKRGEQEEDLGPEVEEELIQPAVAKREVIIGSDSIEFFPKEKPEEDPDRSRSPSPLAFTSSGSSRPRPASPEGDPVEEEVIEASVASRDAQAAPLPRSSRSRERASEGKGGKSGKAEKEKEKQKPQISEDELERLIAMNAFPPGSQGWAGIKAGGKQGGVHDEFVPRDLAQPAVVNQKHNQHQRSGSSSSDASSSQSLSSRSQRSGGVAFEVRDDMVTGRPVSVDISRSRNNSASPSRSGSTERGDYMGRATSPRDELLQKQQQKHQQKQQQQRQQRGLAEDKENNRGDEGLDWSGKRLVRSGSFPEIPQDDSISDWTDKNTLNDDDDNDVDDDFSSMSGKRSNADANLESDSEADHLAPLALPGRDIFKARENLANMSDLSNSMSSSRSSSPPVAAVVTSNGPAEGLGSVEDGFTIIDLDSTSDANANSKKRVSVTLSADIEEDMDC